MRAIQSTTTLNIPEGVEVSIDKRVVTVKGKRGTLTRSFTHAPIDLKVDAKKDCIVAEKWFGKQLENASIKSVLSHITNMMTGVTKGYRYRMRFAYAHFPVSVAVEDGEVTVRNFLGEKRVRRVNLLGDTTAKRTETNVTKDELVVEGNNISDVSQTAAAVHGACLVKRKDIRKFLDGIYVSAKENLEE